MSAPAEASTASCPVAGAVDKTMIDNAINPIHFFILFIFFIFLLYNLI
jgi:hypothetical protein